MAVSKRTRYEVLRRDGYACRYCGGRAPDVILTVDNRFAYFIGTANNMLTDLQARARQLIEGGAV